MSLRILDYLEHILQALRRIDRYRADLKEEEFLANELIQDGVIRNLEVMGEVAKNIESRDPSFAAGHPELMLKDIYLMRNRLSHGYFSVDMGIVWRTVQRDLPELKLHIVKTYETLKLEGLSKP